MKGYSSDMTENCACARLEGVNASYKDLAEVCGRIKNKKTTWALSFLEKASRGEVPVLYRTRNKRLAHRKELGGRKGRYPKKAAGVVLKVLKSAVSNGRNKGLGEEYTILTASANKKDIYPRLAPKGRWARSYLEMSRVEIILRGEEVPKGVEVTPPKKPEKPEKKPEKPEKKEEKPKEEKKGPAEKQKKKQPKLLKRAMKREVYQDEVEEKENEPEEMPHSHGEYRRK
ncbi:hypothetical protein GF318_04150 [Candidatus Micrarchaeota archaeon]|nr:hypothetical protein [Candidatus Micrarchaeota archaeon]